MNNEDIKVNTMRNNKIPNDDEFLYDNSDTGELLKSIVFNTFKIKYEELNSKLEELNVIIDKPVSLYINLTSIMEKFFTKNIIENDPIYKENYMNMTIYILNLVLHYRRYLFGRRNQENKIYLLFKSPEIGKREEFALLNHCVNTNMKLIKELCPYIPGVYFIDSTEYINECNIIEYIMLKDMDENKNFRRFHWILSRDITDIQALDVAQVSTRDILVTMLKYDIMRKENSSIFLYKGNIFNGLSKIYKSKASDIDEAIRMLDSLDDNVNLIHTIQLLNLDSLIPIRKSFRKIIKTIYDNLDSVYIGYSISFQNTELFKRLYTKKEIDSVQEFIDNKGFDKLYLSGWVKFNVLLFNNADETYIDSCIYDLKNRSLYEINNLQYITPNLFIDIETLIKGGDIDNGNRRKTKKIQW